MSANIGEGKYVISVDNSGAISQLGQFEQKAKSTGQGVKDSFLLGASGALNLAGGLRGLYGQFDSLEKVQLRIKKTNLEVSRAQEELNKLTVEGRSGTLDYEQALQRLEIAKEKNRQANDDLFKGNLDVALSIGQIAVGIPAAIKALEGLSAVKKVLTATTWAETFAFLANPLFAIPTAAAIAAAVGLVATNTWGLRDALFGTTEAVEANTDAMKVYNGELSGYENTARSASSTTRDLNKEMDHTISLLKKNEISDELIKIKGEMLDGMVIIGSLEQVYNNFKSAGVDGFVKEVAKDTRTIDNINKVKSAVISLYSVISGRAIPKDALGPNITSANEFGRLRIGGHWLTQNTIASSRIQDIFGAPQYSRASRGGVSFLGGQAGALKSAFNSLGGVNMTGINSQKLTTGLRTITKGAKHGGFKRGFGVQEVNRPFLESINKLQPTIDEFAALGFNIQAPNFNLDTLVRGIKSPSNEFLQQSIRQATAQYELELARYNQQVSDARRIIEDRIMGLASRSGLSRSQVVAMQSTQQGTDDLYGIIDYRERLARASTGSG